MQLRTARRSIKQAKCITRSRSMGLQVTRLQEVLCKQFKGRASSLDLGQLALKSPAAQKCLDNLRWGDCNRTGTCWCSAPAALVRSGGQTYASSSVLGPANQGVHLRSHAASHLHTILLQEGLEVLLQLLRAAMLAVADDWMVPHHKLPVSTGLG